MRSATRADGAAGLIPDGAGVMVGGFLGVGTPERLVDALVARGLTAILRTILTTCLAAGVLGGCAAGVPPGAGGDHAGNAGIANTRPQETRTVTGCLGDTYGLGPHYWRGRVWNPSLPAAPERRMTGCPLLRRTAHPGTLG